MSPMKKETTAAYRLAYTFPLFEYADANDVIKVCIIGSDPFCEEYLKAAVWSTQRDGFRLAVDLFTSQSETERLGSLYPELFHTDGLSDSGEIFYDIRLLGGVPRAEYGFVLTTGAVCVQASANAALSVVISDGAEKEAPVPKTVYFSPEELCDERFFTQNGLEKQALSLFRSFKNSERNFYENEFCYRSSVAAAMFWDIRRRQGESIEVCERNMKLEHRRWNAFTRTEGYRYGAARSDTEKTHPCLVAWNMLSSEYQKYDANPIKNAGSFADN